MATKRRRLTAATTLDNLKKEAKRWLKALRANDERARLRLDSAWPNAPADPGLRDAQHALALEYGLPGWTALKNALAGRAPGNEDHAELVKTFLENACADPILANGPAAHVRRSRTALRILKRYPEIQRDSIHTAVVCGDLEEVERILAERPEAAIERGGPQRRRHLSEREQLWTPLLHLCYGRLPVPAASENAVAIARVLLDHGANPNDYFEVGDGPNRYTTLCGVAGEGEDDAPPHPQREALARLLLERGAEPYDIQLLYNTHFRGDTLWIVELIYEFAIKAGRQFDLADPEWSMINMGGYGHGARYLLDEAIANNNIKLAEWLLAHGASPNAAPGPHPKISKRSLHEEAVLRGYTEIADLLVRYGATPGSKVRQGIEGFAEVCLRLDEKEARTMLEQHPEYLRSPLPMFAAAQMDRADVVAFLLDLGMSIEIEDNSKQRPLHVAAAHDSLRVAALLIERGAELEPVETNWNNTPLDNALYANLTRMIWFLSGFTRDVFRLAWIGNIERLRELLSEEPDLAKAVKDGATPLMWLPDDDARAKEIAELLIANGADPSVKSHSGGWGNSFQQQGGKTAADYARKRGLYEAAELLDSQANSSALGSPNNSSGSADPGDAVDHSLERYEKVVEDLLEAYRTGDSGALQRLAEHAGQSLSWDRLRKNVELALGKTDISLTDARLFLARVQGFESWQALVEHVAAQPATAMIIGRPVKLFSIDETGNEHTAASARDWNTVIGLMEENRIPGLDAEGQMTDTALERISRLSHVRSLKIGGSTKLTDEGLLHLARMPQLQHLDLSGWEMQITDRGLAVLRQLTGLRRFQMCWPQRVSDAGVANLKYCNHLESVDLLGTPTGDGAIQALTGKPKLCRFKTGSQVTDAGLERLHDFPIFKTWQGGEVKYSLMSPDAEPNHLLIDGPVTNNGLASLAGLDGLFGLSLFWHVTALTPDGLRSLAHLPNLGFLGCEGQLCNDEAMRHIAAIPRLRMLMAQGTVAGDDGFAALSGSQTIEYIWGRECPNLRGRGFAAMAAMPALRGLAVSCANVNDDGLSALPRFPALRELMPMDVPDGGYRHIGRCTQLESLILMYCRDTTDVATENIAGLPGLKKYFASYTKITDRSMEILSSMTSLEEIAFYGCAGVTNAGVAMLASLPRLREVRVSGPQITRECAAAFPASVQLEIGT
jgi:ankyrin repeat protein